MVLTKLTLIAHILYVMPGNSWMLKKTIVKEISIYCLRLKRMYRNNISESDTLGPIDNFSDIEILVSLERDMFACNSFTNKMKIFLYFMSISPLWNTCL